MIWEKARVVENSQRQDKRGVLIRWSRRSKEMGYKDSPVGRGINEKDNYHGTMIKGESLPNIQGHVMRSCSCKLCERKVRKRRNVEDEVSGRIWRVGREWGGHYGYTSHLDRKKPLNGISCINMAIEPNRCPPAPNAPA
ncbi:hypothetical protein IAR55_001034 [Kwoniella newhampshirensis]|uniref:Uncharacterized protein n=1 Tax=Kwoniella newhampshirensis TaxID=1651941 RepID=A0AAW0Z4K6_9TREE